MDLIVGIYQQALKDYECAFLQLRLLENKEGQEEKIARYKMMKEEAEHFMLTGGGYAINPDTVERIAKCFAQFQHIVENM